MEEFGLFPQTSGRISDFSVMLCTTLLGKYPNKAKLKPGDLAQHYSQSSTVTDDIFIASTSNK